MSPILLAALLVCPPDRIVLGNGAVLDGTIEREDDETIEIRLDSGGRIGLERRFAVEIVREPRPTAPPQAPDAPEVEPREGWFLVRDARGAVVGTRRFFRSSDPFRGKPALRLEELWRFFDEAGDTLVAQIEWVDPGGNALGFQYREETAGRSRLVLGEIRGENLQLTTKGAAGATEATVAFLRGTRLPLQARDALREKSLASGRSYSFAVFDPREATFVRREFECPVESRAPVSGGDLPLLVLVETRYGRRSEEWIDPRRGTVLFEVNGKDLVAHLCTADEASGARATPRDEASGLVTAANGRMRFSLPNPNWEPAGGGDGGAAFFRDRSNGALVCVLPLVDLDAELLIDGACLSLEDRLRGSVQGFTRSEMPRAIVVRGLPAREFRFEGRGSNGKVHGRAVLVQGEREAIAAVLLTPEASLSLASTDFDRFLVGADLNL